MFEWDSKDYIKLYFLHTNDGVAAASEILVRFQTPSTVSNKVFVKFPSYWNGKITRAFIYRDVTPATGYDPPQMTVDVGGIASLIDTGDALTLGIEYDQPLEPDAFHWIRLQINNPKSVGMFQANVFASGPLLSKYSGSALVTISPTATINKSSLSEFGVVFYDDPSIKFGSNTKSDIIKGTTAGDTIRGVGGDDQLFGLGGPDDLFGGSGKDIIKGGYGGDTILGGADGDQIYGGYGSDSLVGEFGDDIIYAGSGNDVLYNDNGADVLIGGGGRNSYGDFVSDGTGSGLRGIANTGNNVDADTITVFAQGKSALADLIYTFDRIDKIVFQVSGGPGVLTHQTVPVASIYPGEAGSAHAFLIDGILEAIVFDSTWAYNENQISIAVV